MPEGSETVRVQGYSRSLVCHRRSCMQLNWL